MNADVIEIIKIIQSHGFQAVIAGGAVRDMLLESIPSDIDIATNATPDQVESMFPRTLAIGKSFGVINLLYNGEEYDVASFRADGDYSDGRHPDSIKYSSMEEDAARRDLTINGLFFDPISGIIHDFVGGQEDLNHRVLRFIGDAEERIQEDHLRMLRLIRFAVRFDDFIVDEMSMIAVMENADKIQTVSAERTREELVKIFSYDKPRLAITLLLISGLMRYILPEIEALEESEQSPKWHPEGGVLDHTILCMENLEMKNIYTRWAALFHDVGKPATSAINENGDITNHGHAKDGADIARAVFQRLRFSNEFIERVVAIIYDHMKAKDALKMNKSTLKRFLAKDYFEDLMAVCKADSLASCGNLEWYDFIMEKAATYTPEQVRPKLLIGGQELIDLGFKPGPIFSRILNEIAELQLEEKLATAEEAIQYVKETWRENYVV